MIRYLAVLVFGLVMVSGAATITSGPVGFAHQVNKYLLDNGVDPMAAHRSGALEISRINGQDVITRWDLAPLALPDSAALDTIEEASAVVNAAPSARVKEGGRYRLKTATEVAADKAATPEGRRRAKKSEARTALIAEVTAVGFTNSVAYVDDINEWLETATLTTAQEKKINRLLTKYTALCAPKIRVDRDEE